ncbi:helix-turn-helix domain-containing protein [Halodesulfurarchaeum sp.]|uniref:helix-turn-helix domain-containing protein n=1 Tax=Halodesulfurarchaeum sp. TaxID=1980530 RepID=UPI002FC2CA42
MLRVVIRLEPEGNCPMLQFDVQPEQIEAQLAGDTCLCKAIVNRSETVIEHTQQTLEDDCACTVFHEHACIADITSVDEHGITITTHVPDRSVVEEIVDDLREVGNTIELMEITSNNDGEMTDRVERVDLSDLTEKQRSAVKLAIEEGYYKRPRETTLEVMAAHLDISQQALSQRLGVVEEKLIGQLFQCP